jgi:DNA-binding GntR family transcriptional regulator
MLSTKATQPTGDDAYSEIRSFLLDGDVQPGQRLSHRLLAKELNLSRSPVREALLRLEAEGLIEHRPQSGAYLREITPRDLRELYEIREILEPHAAEQAARLATASQRGRLAKICEELTTIASRPDLAKWLTKASHRRQLSSLDREFHAVILTAAGNRIARQFFETAQVLSLVFFWNHMQVPAERLAKRVVPTAKQHRRIEQAIRRGDPTAARRSMKAHIAGMSRRILASLPERTPASQ